MNAAASARRGAAIPGAVAGLLLLLMMATYVAGYAWSAPHTDTADELLRAFEIRHAIAYPLEGPPLGGVLHLGPVWFYLTAISLWIHDSWLCAALFIGFTCSLKFPLAYFCGSRLIDRDFGLLWAAGMFMPGWSSFEQLVFLNPNAVAAAALAVLAIILFALDRARLVVFAALGLALAIAAHVHPTAAPIAFLALIPFARYRSQGGSMSKALAVFSCAFLVPFIPYVVSQASHGFPDLIGARQYVGDKVVLANALNGPAVIWNYIEGGPAIIAEYFLGWTARQAAALGIGIAVLAGACIAGVGAAAPAPVRRLLVWFLVTLLVVSCWIGALRPTTPLQFTWALEPIVGGVFGLGLWFLGRARAGRLFVVAGVAAIVLSNLYVVRAMALKVRDGEGALPLRILDIKIGPSRVIFRGVWFPAMAHGALGEMLCAAAKPASLHGHLAYLADKDLGLDMLFACGDRSRVELGGAGGRSHYLGMTRPFWRSIDAKPECWIGSLGISRDAGPISRTALAPADGATYLPRRASGRAPESILRSFTASAGDAIMVTNVLGDYEHFAIDSARANGRDVAPVSRNDLSALFVPPADASGDVAWEIAVSASSHEGIDMVFVPRGRREAGARNDGTCVAASGRPPG